MLALDPADIRDIEAADEVRTALVDQVRAAGRSGNGRSPIERVSVPVPERVRPIDWIRAQAQSETIYWSGREKTRTVAAVGLAGTAIGLAIWATSSLTAMTNSGDAPVTRMAEETSFISVWVIGAYLAYEYLAAFGGLDLEAYIAELETGLIREALEKSHRPADLGQLPPRHKL